MFFLRYSTVFLNISNLPHSPLLLLTVQVHVSTMACLKEIRRSFVLKVLTYQLLLLQSL
jgi:hypothetical protein